MQRRNFVKFGVAGAIAPALTILSPRAHAAEFTYKFAQNLPVTHPLYLRSVEDECLLRRIRRRGGWSHLPVVVLTGWTTEPHRTLARDEGADVYLPLPVGPRQLLAAVNRLLAGGSARAPMSPGTASREDPRDHPVLRGVLGL